MNNLSFFLIDDDEIFQFIMKNTIAEISPDIKIKFFSDGEKGMDFLKQNLGAATNLPDIILLDVNMPFMDGWEFLKEYKSLQTQIKKDVNIYLLTSSNNPHDIAMAKEISELSGYLVKPISKEGIKNLISHFPTTKWYHNEF
ncbi:response regulator receiver domain-containing protein [Arenibacter algicola]|jgi:CheY-like chemotaxis protein|uniref:Response regulator receiver domain-containing protein n=1 Tax=Arenibacter algicola TaxID=616991 RepID=A0ABY3ACL8_9FLAO|nr:MULTISPECIES: response regulator [Arenibacter]MBD3661714.1 response regulator [Arenibacter algicola]GBF21207.1 cyclic di-GMP phosphodiesterase response regulator RpfG [Arenibacter sp. NBRC 103722]|tara:strand:+ start:22753 stop:23178 length:426 start_codon:yes stop_codon:yes gene_type:complete